MTKIPTLDVTQIEPTLRLSNILQYFDALQEGETFVIKNDHDPKSLYYKLLIEKGANFSWEYLEDGPTKWRIKINKKMLLDKEETIGEMAAKDLRKAEVFNKFGLNFCCDGNKSLKESCKDAGVSLEEVSAALIHAFKNEESPTGGYNSWNLDFLTDYIVNVHHRYIRDTSPILNDLSKKTVQQNGAAHPELIDIEKQVGYLLEGIQYHQDKEEKILFPIIRKIVRCEWENKPLTNSPFKTIKDPIKKMSEDHVLAGENILSIRKLSNNYIVPADASDNYHLFYHKLFEFDEALQKHIHLENNILFPKIIKLEKKLNKDSV